MSTEQQYWITGDICLDVMARQACKKHVLINLSDLSYQTMKALMAAYPHSVSNEQLVDQVWRHTAVSPETVTQRIAIIRKALVEADIDPKSYLSATRHVGYRWLKPVNKTTRLKHKNKHRLVVISAVLLMLLIGWLFFSDVLFKGQEQAEVSKVNSTAVVSSEELADQAWNYLGMHNAHSNKLAMGLFREALSLDSNHVDSLTGLSFALSHEVTKFNQDNDLLVEARSLALKAIEIDELNARAWTALAFVDDANGHLDQAIEGYENAIKLAPQNTSAISSLAYLYGVKGQLVDALRLNVSVLGSDQHYLDLQLAHVLELLGFEVLAEQWYNKADILSPDNVFVTHSKSKFLLSNNKVNLAVSVINEAKAKGLMRPELPILLGLLAWKTADFDVALSHFENAIEIDSGNMSAQLLMNSLLMESTPGDVRKNRLADIENKWFEQPYTWPDSWIYQAHFYAQIGDLETALKSLRQGFISGYRDYQWLSWLPAFDVLKNKFQWRQLMIEMQADVSAQRQQVLHADWLPTSFLDPKN